MEQENVIRFKPLEEKSSNRKFKSIKNKRSISNNKANTEDKVSNITNTNNSANGPEITANNNKRKILWSIVGIVIILGIIVALIIALVKKNRKFDDNLGNENPQEDDQGIIYHPDKPSNKNDPHLETEFEFNTQVKDLKRIFVEQKYTENVVIDGIEETVVVDRKTNYDIFIISEEPSDEENKNFYNKKYTAAISIANQCISSEEEDCQPFNMIDIREIAKHNLRNLDELPDMKDLPIPLCLFNLTDNDVITSMTCPGTLSDSQKRTIILDLYFFRPPAIKRPDKVQGNITITKWRKNNREYIRETNGGICDILNPLNSFCLTDMNTTTDLKKNLLAYDELAFTNITRDEKNYYIKNKITNLVDKTESINSSDSIAYEEALNKILLKLKPYMSFDEHFSTEQFKELYKVSKNITDNDEKNNKLRNLFSEANNRKLVKEEQLFNFEHYGGVNLFYFLKDDIGLDSESMKAYGNLLIDDYIKELSNLKEFTNLDKIIEELLDLSQSGKELASGLLNSTKDSFDNITQIISENINKLNQKIVYKDLSEIFDSTLSIESLKKLPISIIQESTNLKDKLYNIINNIEKGGMKNNINILNEKIYNYIRNSHILINNIFKNLNKLGKSLSSSKSKLTEISTYYLNNTSTSYINTIEEAQNILLNYYKDEKDFILPKVNSLCKEFEDATKESIQKDEKIVNNLYQKLENKKINIEYANNDDYKKINLNLYNSQNYISDIIEKGMEKIKNEMDLKNSGYFISNDDIKTNNYSFTQTINEAKEIALKLDNDEYIDKSFDQTMINLKANYTYIKKDMDKVKEEQFPLNEDVLKDGFLSTKDQESMTNEIQELGLHILDDIRNENDDYLKSIQNEINTFIKENKDDLNDLILNLTLIFSEESLKNLSNLYDKAFKNSLNKIQNDIETNKNLAQNYFTELAKITTDNNKLIELLKSFKTDQVNLPYRYNGKYFRGFTDSISSKSKTLGYLGKYSIYKGILLSSKNYIKDQLYIDLKNEYKNVITKLKESLQHIRNTKINDKYPDFPELNFVENNINKIEGLYNRLDSYLSDNLFNKNYLPKINEYKSDKIKEIENIDNSVIENNHVKINTQTTANDNTNDFCIAFLRKKTYTCTNGAISYYTNSDNYCFPLSSYTNNHNKLIAISINKEPSVQNFKSDFNNFYLKVEKIVNLYYSKINNIKNYLTNLEKKIIEKNTVNDYLLKTDEKVNTILSNKYGDNLIKASYEYYQKVTEKRLNTIFEDISDKWMNMFSLLKKDINNNLNNYKNSISEFGVMAIIYETLFSTNITSSYFDSIIIHQKNEFNYTISYYYNYLLKSINFTRQYIISKIPVNKDGFNTILNKRNNEVNNYFKNIISKILKSKDYAMTLNNQIYVLQVPITNFFKVNTILSNLQTTKRTSFLEIVNSIYSLSNDKVDDEYSLSARFYLENAENGKQITEFYEPIDNKVFFYLNLEKFKDLIINNWIFDQDDFIKQLNLTLYNINLETSKEFLTVRENYTSILEKQITKYFTKESIVEKINNLYETSITEIQYEQISQIKQNINAIIQEIKDNLRRESIRLNTTSTSYYNNYNKINETIEEYKKDIFEKVNKTIFNIINNFYENLYKNVYINYIEKYLNEYLNNTRATTETFMTFYLLNSSYDIKETINEIVYELTEDYKNIVKKQINTKYKEYYDNLYDEINIKNIKSQIYNEIDLEYTTYLYESLKLYAIFPDGDYRYTLYDLSKDIRENIDNFVDLKIANISKITNITKGNNYEVDIRTWEILDYSLVNKEINHIKDLFDKFIVAQKKNEENIVNKCIQDLIKSNFYDLLNNLIPSFGNEFFERIIKYNENFKITNLYDNLKYSLSQTLTYYASLYSLSQIRALTKDLKIRLYSLNNLDTIVEQKNKQVLELLNLTVDEFINQSKNHIIQKYISFFKADTSIELSFNAEIKKKIDENLNSVISDIELDFIELLNIYLKEKLVSSYTNVLNSKTEEMLRNIRSQRELIKSRIDDLFSLNSDEVLNNINLNINNTLKSINEYKVHFDKFEIPEELFNYLNNYGKNIIKPSYDNLEKLLNKVTKDLILTNLESNSKVYENSYKIKEFNNLMNETYSSIKSNYIKKINDSIYSYGLDNYPYNLNLKMNQKSLRRLDNDITEEEKTNEKVLRVAVQSIDDTINQLLISSENAKRFIKTFEKFDEFDNILKKNINNLNYAYKLSKQIIEDYNFEEDTELVLNNKLSYLQEITSDYYNKINNTFYDVKTYLDDSITKLDDLLIKCANITANTFIDKYSKISIKVQTVDNEQNEDENELNIKGHPSTFQNTIFYTDVNIKYMKKKAWFKFTFEYDKKDGFQIPKIYAHVINLSYPKKANFKVYSTFGVCGKRVQEIDAEFNNANYSIFLDFNSNTNNILATINTNFDDYQYSVERYKTKDIKNPVCIGGFGMIDICYGQTKCTDEINQTEVIKSYVQVPKKSKNENLTIYSLN